MADGTGRGTATNARVHHHVGPEAAAAARVCSEYLDIPTTTTTITTLRVIKERAKPRPAHECERSWMGQGRETNRRMKFCGPVFDNSCLDLVRRV
jgi:hypothetical protein